MLITLLVVAVVGLLVVCVSLFYLVAMAWYMVMCDCYGLLFAC